MERKISLTVDFGFEFGIKYWFFVVFGRLVFTVNNRILVFFSCVYLELKTVV